MICNLGKELSKNSYKNLKCIRSELCDLLPEVWLHVHQKLCNSSFNICKIFWTPNNWEMENEWKASVAAQTHALNLGLNAWTFQNCLWFFSPMIVIKCAEMSDQISYWEPDKFGLTGPFNFWENLIWGSSLGILRSIFPTWDFLLF